MIYRGIDKINIGMLTEKLLFLKPELTKNARGAVSTEYIEDTAAYAMIEFANNNEQESLYNLTEQPVLKITTYIKKDVNTAWKIKINNENFNITSVIPVFGQPFMIISATKTN